MSPFSIVIIPCPIVNEVGFIPTIRPKGRGRISNGKWAHMGSSTFHWYFFIEK
jgi:hypothetical protein